MASDCAGALVCAAAAADAIKKRPKNRFMLDLVLLMSVPETIAIGCNPAGDRVLLF